MDYCPHLYFCYTPPPSVIYYNNEEGGKQQKLNSLTSKENTMNIIDNGTSFTINGREVEKLHDSHKVINGIIVIPHIGPGRVPM